MPNSNENLPNDLTDNGNQPQRRRTVHLRIQRNQPRPENQFTMDDRSRDNETTNITERTASNQDGELGVSTNTIQGSNESTDSVRTEDDNQEQLPSNENGVPELTIRNIDGNTFVQTVHGRNVTIANNGQARQQQRVNPQITQPPQGPRIIRLPPGSIPPGTRQIRIPPEIGNVRIAGVTSPMHGQNPNSVPRVNIPKLVPQPIPNKTRPTTSKEDDELEEKYHCPICCDFLNLPSSCGNCSSRFCNQCLRRVADSPLKSSKCPACRSPLSAESIVQDEELIREMEQADIHVTCPDCGKRLKAALAKEHETSCEYTMMRCKNASVGCSWRGIRKNLNHHLAAHCHVERIAGLVDQFRHTKADQESAIIALQQRQFMTNQMVDLNTSWTRKSLPSPGNIFDLLNLTYTASCTPAHFLITADRWSPFLANNGAQESRAALCNILYMLPTIFNLCRVSN